ncbi:MAG TPA: gamma-glutamyltransferase [Candidatus Ozemobacteraceae bacterium]|mgnify:CR=1 FL=1|nr:gamma-glutamyltransferase [Candidatus Ozemobacteraceae bacterium]
MIHVRRFPLPLLLLLFALLSHEAPAREFVSHGPGGAASTGHERATQAALDLLDKGGNAVDAAVAAAFMLAVVEPSNSGLGGDGFAILRLPAKGLEAWDASSPLPPGAATGSSDIGLPTEPAFLLHLHDRHGSRSRAEVLAPAIRVAAEGFPVSAYLARRIEERLPRLRDPLARRVFAPTGRPPAPGERLVQPALARTLRLLASRGLPGLSQGLAGGILAGDLRARGSFYPISDITNFRPRFVRPAVLRIGRYTLAGPPPPSSAVVVMAGLKAVFDLERRQGGRASPEQRIRIIERLFFLMSSLLPASIGSPARFLIEAERSLAAIGTRPEPPAPDSAEMPGETTHLVTWDRTGMIVSMTLTLGTHFGTGDFCPLGFFYNNETANRKNPAFRYPPTYPADAGPVSTKSPLLVFDRHRPVCAIGGAGAGRIVSNLFLILDALLHGDRSLPDAVHAPRIHIQRSGGLQVEQPPVPSALPGSRRISLLPAGADLFGLVSAVGVASQGLVAVGDTRRDGAAGTLPEPSPRR